MLLLEDGRALTGSCWICRTPDMSSLRSGEAQRQKGLLRSRVHSSQKKCSGTPLVGSMPTHELCCHTPQLLPCNHIVLLPCPAFASLSGVVQSRTMQMAAEGVEHSDILFAHGVWQVARQCLTDILQEEQLC